MGLKRTFASVCLIGMAAVSSWVLQGSPAGAAEITESDAAFMTLPDSEWMSFEPIEEMILEEVSGTSAESGRLRAPTDLSWDAAGKIRAKIYHTGSDVYYSVEVNDKYIGFSSETQANETEVVRGSTWLVLSTPMNAFKESGDYRCRIKVSDKPNDFDFSTGAVSDYSPVYTYKKPTWKLATPSRPYWSGNRTNTILWETVDYAGGYRINLYRKDEGPGSVVVNTFVTSVAWRNRKDTNGLTTVTETVGHYDFSSFMKDDAYYSCTVQALSGDLDTMIDGDVSVMSESNEYGGSTIVDDPVFLDVQDSTAFYYTPVYWAYQNNITKGVSVDRFAPNEYCTRAQIVTFLWTAAGKPEPEQDGQPFRDVALDSYYCKAVQWALENQITSGTSSLDFSPNEPCTRAQIVTFLWRYLNCPNGTGTTNFQDVYPGNYFEAAVDWAATEGITSGISSKLFGPHQPCTRGQCVTFLYRALSAAGG